MVIFFMFMAGLGVLGIFSIVNALTRLQEQLDSLEQVFLEASLFNERY